MTMAAVATMDIAIRVNVDENTVGRCFAILEMWLADHPDKTIKLVDENDKRVFKVEVENDA